MPYERTFEEPNAARPPACRYLRSKAMYVTGDVDPTNPDEVDSHSYFWCNRTQNVVGPDEGDVDRVECAAGRKCYEAR